MIDKNAGELAVGIYNILARYLSNRRKSQVPLCGVVFVIAGDLTKL